MSEINSLLLEKYNKSESHVCTMGMADRKRKLMATIFIQFLIDVESRVHEKCEYFSGFCSVHGGREDIIGLSINEWTLGSETQTMPSFL